MAAQFPMRSEQRKVVKDGGSALSSVLTVVNGMRQARVVKAGVAETARWFTAASTATNSGGRLLSVTRGFLASRTAGAEVARIARVSGRANVALSVAFTAADLYFVVRDHKADRRREQEFQETLDALNDQARQWARRVADDDPALGTLTDEAAEHAVALAALTVDAEDQSRELAALRHRLDVYEQAVEHGRRCLGASVRDQPVATAY